MDATRAPEMRQRVTTLLEEMGGMLSMVPRLLEENAGLKASGESAARELETLRAEVTSMKGELQQLVGERNEFQQIFTQTMNEIIDLMNQVVPRLGAPRRSAFGRDGAPTEQAAPAAVPSVAPAAVTSATPAAWRS